MGLLSSFVFSVLVAASPPPPVLTAGVYEVQHDTVDVVPVQWDFDCGPLSPPPVAKRGARVIIDLDDSKKTFHVTGAGRAFGSKRCEGENPSLAVLSTYVDNGKHILRCRSTRVVRGTEETEHSIEPLADGRVKVIARFERKARVRRNNCRMTLERHTVLAPVRASVIDDTAPDAPKMLPQADTASIEKALEAELVAAQQEAALSMLTVSHEHRMSSDFKLLEARYVLDGKELKDNGRSWPMLKSDESRVVFQDLATIGTHVLEVELVYLTTVNGAPARVRLKDAVFFDLTENKGARLVVVGQQVGSPLTPVEKRAGLSFLLNGKPAAK